MRSRPERLFGLAGERVQLVQVGGLLGEQERAECVSERFACYGVAPVLRVNGVGELVAPDLWCGAVEFDHGRGVSLSADRDVGVLLRPASGQGAEISTDHDQGCLSLPGFAGPRAPGFAGPM